MKGIFGPSMAILEEYRQKSRTRDKRSYRRLVLLGGPFCVVVGMMVALNYYGGTSETKPAKRGKSVAATVPASATPRAAKPKPLAKPWTPLAADQERELLSKIVDQAPLGVREHSEAYYYLLNKVARMTHAAIADEVDRTITYSDFDNQPDIVRGSFVEIAGHLLRLEKTPLDADASGLAAVYEGQIMDPDSLVYSFVLTDLPRAPFVPGHVRPRDALRVRLRGVFMQVIAYQNNEDPPKYVVTPLIIGRRLVQLKRDRGSAVPAWVWIVGFAGLSAVVGGVMVLHLRRPRAS